MQIINISVVYHILIKTINTNYHLFNTLVKFMGKSESPSQMLVDNCMFDYILKINMFDASKSASLVLAIQRKERKKALKGKHYFFNLWGLET